MAETQTNTERLINHQDAIDIKNSLDNIKDIVVLNPSSYIQFLMRVRWSDSPIEDVKEVVDYAYENDLNLHDDFGWEVGAERVEEGTTSGSYTRLVLADFNTDSEKLYKLADGTAPKAIVINCSTDTLDATCISSKLLSLFKTFKCHDYSYDNGYIELTGTYAPLAPQDLVYGDAMFDMNNISYITSYNPEPNQTRRLKLFETPYGNRYIKTDVIYLSPFHDANELLSYNKANMRAGGEFLVIRGRPSSTSNWLSFNSTNAARSLQPGYVARTSTSILKTCVGVI